MTSRGGTGPWLQSAKLYLTRSWLATVFILGVYIVLLWIYLANEAGSLALFMLFLASVGLVSSRLKALMAYSLAYMAPGYRRIQLVIGFGLLFLAGLLAVLLEFKSDMTTLQVVAFITVSTGVILLGDYRMPRTLAFSIGVGVVLSIALLSVKIQASWNPSPAHSTLLILLGTMMTIVYARLILAGKDYDPDFRNDLSGAVGSFWLKDFTTTLVIPHASVQKILGGGRIESAVVRFQSSAKSFADFARLLNVSVGDWAYWRSVQKATLMACTLMAAVAIIANKERLFEVLPYIMVIIIFNIQAFGAMGYVAGLRWPLAAIWRSSPLPDKETHVKVMTLAMVGNVLYYYVQAVAVSFLILLVVDELANFEIYLTVLLAVNIQGMALGLIFVRFRHLASLLQFLIVLIWICLSAWLCHPVWENLWAFALLLLSTSSVMFLLTMKWWFDGFFSRNEYSLDY
jgi:hypothetical protein|tara:strand:+ start:2492 stop:3865 length:1374 start_codon:yes stop_codon:yes gene_type:complete